jgi:putative Mg2+ transporter-C (MgtC) family protein
MLEEIFRGLAAEEGSLPLSLILLRLVAATLCGAAIGLEREAAEKPAGLRTLMLVSLSACAFTVLALELAGLADDVAPEARPDPVRVVEAVITGVAFLGAGSIIRGRTGVQGVTTGATIWLVGALGTACGAGLLRIAVAVTLLSLFVLIVLRWGERWALRRRHGGHRGHGRDGRGGGEGG